MGLIVDIMTVALLGTGCFFGVTGAVGVLRMPDFFSRIHPAGKSDTMAQSMILMGLLLQADDLGELAKLLLIMTLLFITSPVAAHAIAHAAWVDGLVPWKREEDQQDG